MWICWHRFFQTYIQGFCHFNFCRLKDSIKIKINSKSIVKSYQSDQGLLVISSCLNFSGAKHWNAVILLVLHLKVYNHCKNCIIFTQFFCLLIWLVEKEVTIHQQYLCYEFQIHISQSSLSIKGKWWAVSEWVRSCVSLAS